MRKAWVLSVLLTIVVAGAGLFANGQSESTSGPVTVQVAYPVAVDAPIAQILNGYVSAFEKANPNITVKPVFSGGYNDVKTAIQTAIQGGAKPPAVGVMLSTDLYDLINAGYIEALDPYLATVKNKDAYLADFFPTFLQNSRFDGKIWSLPFQRSAVVMYYNKDLFKQSGLSAPNSWDTMAKDAQALTVRNGDTVTRWGILWSTVGLPYWLFQPLAIGAGQNIVGSSDTTVYFNNPAVIDAIKYYISLSQTYHATPPGAQDTWGVSPTDLASGRAAMIMHSTGSLAGILKQSKFDVGVMAVPGKEPNTYASVPGGGNLYIMKDAPKAEKDAAFKFILFLTQPDNVADFSIKTGYIATRQSAYETQAMKDYIAKVPQAAETRDALKYAGKEMAVQDLGKVRDLFQNYLQLALNGKLSPEEAMQKAQTEADAALKAFK
ncbi:MAG TPA: ABC transporter substrate-binding protein [Spirochaetia bacterium]|nr:ABC transporter substrate-binding protein [Spirochaetia bacterium]